MKPVTVGALRKMLKGMPDKARVIMLSDEEGNALYYLYEVTVDNVKAPTRVFLRPAGSELEVEMEEGEDGP